MSPRCMRHPLETPRWRLGAAIWLVAAVVLAGACSGGQPSNPGDRPPASSDSSGPPPTPFPFSTPQAEKLPNAAEPLPTGDYGIEPSDSGSLKGTLQAAKLSCDDDGFLHVDTDDGAFLAGVVKAGDWDCQKALTQWEKGSSSSKAIGLRYTSAPDMDTILLVNDSGASMTMRVSGAWKVS